MVEQLYDPVFLIIADNQRDPFQGGYLFRPRLRIAAGNDDFCQRVEAQRPPDELSRLKIGKTGDGTGVDDIGVGKRRKRRHRKTGGFEIAGQGCGIALVNFATQCGYGYLYLAKILAQWFLCPLVLFGVLSIRPHIVCQGKQKMDFITKIS